MCRACTPHSGRRNADVLSKRCQIPSGWTNKNFDEVLVDTTDADHEVGGAYRDRTDDLLNANQALSQLS